MVPASRLPLSQSSSALAWFFVTIWGSGYLATKVGLQYAAPFTFLALRFSFGLLLLVGLLAIWHHHEPLRWPAGAAQWRHVVVAGVLMHAVNLGGSHYAQYLGMSAGVVALVLATQPLATAAAAVAFLRERLHRRQWIGVALGLAGVLLVVWHKIDVKAISWPAVVAVTVALVSITAGTLYQRHFCPTVDLRPAAFVQFAATVLVMAPLAVAFEGFRVDWAWPLAAAIGFLVIFASIFAVNALHTLMRRGEATRVTSLLYLTPIIAVVLEWLMFAIVPGALTLAGIVVTCAAVALVVWRPRAAGA